MRICSKIGPLPPGVAVAARRAVAGDRILLIVSDAYYKVWTGAKPGLLMTMAFDAVNHLLEAPEDFGPVEIPAPREALVS